MNESKGKDCVRDFEALRTQHCFLYVLADGIWCIETKFEPNTGKTEFDSQVDNKVLFTNTVEIPAGDFSASYKSIMESFKNVGHVDCEQNTNFKTAPERTYFPQLFNLTLT